VIIAIISLIAYNCIACNIEERVFIAKPKQKKKNTVNTILNNSELAMRSVFKILLHDTKLAITKKPTNITIEIIPISAYEELI